MRTVARNSDELKHWFANRYRMVLGSKSTWQVVRNPNIASAGRCSNMSYETQQRYFCKKDARAGRSSEVCILYSYSTPIAAIWPKQKVIVITPTTHSSTTSRHKPGEYDFPADMRNGVNGWRVLHVGMQAGGGRYDSRGFAGISGVEDWVQYHVSWAEECLSNARLPRIQDKTRRSYLATAKSWMDGGIALAKEFRVKVPKDILAGKVDIEALKAWAAQQAAADKAAAEKRAREQAAQEKRVAPLVEKMRAMWRAGDQLTAMSCPAGVSPADWSLAARLGAHPTMLRVTRDQQYVETSRGARVSLRSMARFWPMLEQMHASLDQGELQLDDRQRGVTNRLLAPYSFVSLTKDTLTVGCHEIPWSEIVGIAPIVLAVAANQPQSVFDEDHLAA